MKISLRKIAKTLSRGDADGQIRSVLQQIRDVIETDKINADAQVRRSDSHKLRLELDIVDSLVKHLELNAPTPVEDKDCEEEE